MRHALSEPSGRNAAARGNRLDAEADAGDSYTMLLRSCLLQRTRCRHGFLRLGAEATIVTVLTPHLSPNHEEYITHLGASAIRVCSARAAAPGNAGEEFNARTSVGTNSEQAGFSGSKTVAKNKKPAMATAMRESQQLRLCFARRSFHRRKGSGFLTVLHRVK